MGRISERQEGKFIWLFFFTFSSIKFTCLLYNRRGRFGNWNKLCAMSWLNFPFNIKEKKISWLKLISESDKTDEANPKTITINVTVIVAQFVYFLKKEHHPTWFCPIWKKEKTFTFLLEQLRKVKCKYPHLSFILRISRLNFAQQH